MQATLAALRLGSRRAASRRAISFTELQSVRRLSRLLERETRYQAKE